MNRVFSMPSKHTFTMKPVKDLLAKYCEGYGADAFAGFNSVASITNDLNPDAPTDCHFDAREFTERLKKNSLDYFLFDPPYSPRQISECYKKIGLPVSQADTQNSKLYSDIKNKASERIKLGGLAICFGWNSNGFGKKRGFEMIDILLVNHGAAHNDTIVTVERKVLLTTPPVKP